MNVVHVPGERRGTVFMYALSTCVWCKRTKALLNELQVEYDYLDVDLESPEERDRAVAQMARHNPARNFPTVVINDKDVVVGFHPERLKELLGP